MGQGAESCGAYDLEYSPFAEGLAFGDWPAQDGTVNVKDMSTRHLTNAIRVAKRMQVCAGFEEDMDMWGDWVDLLTEELDRRPAEIRKVRTAPPAPTRGAKLWLQCHCGTKYHARVADLERGWGRSCSKACAATKREFGRPDPVEVDTGLTVKQALKKRAQGGKK